MTTKRSRTTKEAVLQQENIRVKIYCDTVAKVANAATKWGSLATIAYFMRAPLIEMAGKTTITDFSIAAIISGSIPGSAVLIANRVLLACALCWGYAERKLRKSKTASMQERIAVLENALDANRTSSGLTPSGDTNPSDK